MASNNFRCLHYTGASRETPRQLEEGNDSVAPPLGIEWAGRETRT